MSGAPYAICDGAPVNPPRRSGLEGQPLETVTDGGLTALFTAHRTPPAASLESLEVHEQVVGEAMREAAVLPVRFGSMLESPADLRELLRARRGALTDALDGVRGCVEMRLLILDSEPRDRPAATSGTEYLRLRGECRRRFRELSEQCAERFDDLALESRFRPSRARSVTLTAAFLLPEENVETFADRVAQLDGHLGGAELASTGPWPPYSFVGDVCA